MASLERQVVKTIEDVLADSKAEPEIFRTVDTVGKRVYVWDAGLKGETHELFRHFHRGIIIRNYISSGSGHGMRCDLIVRNGVVMAQHVKDLQAELEVMRQAQKDSGYNKFEYYEQYDRANW